MHNAQLWSHVIFKKIYHQYQSVTKMKGEGSNSQVTFY